MRALGVSLSWCLVATSVFAAASARAEPAPYIDRAALAEALFERGKSLMAKRLYDEACPMLAESQRIDPAGGTLLTLALCHERQGKIATAWTELNEALARAQRDGESERATVARQHATALEPKLSRLAIHLAPAVLDTPGLSIRRDGIPLGRASWEIAAPVDPGEHDIEVTAPGKHRWSTHVRVGPDGDRVGVDVLSLPDLERPSAPVASLPAAVAPAPPLAAIPSSRLSERTIAAISMSVVAAVSLGIGTGYGVRALELQSTANKTCPMTACNDREALQANASARSAAWVADVALPLAAAAAVPTVVLFATSPKKPAAPSSSWIFQVTPRRDPFVSVATAF